MTRVAVVGLGASGSRLRAALDQLGCETAAVRRSGGAGDLGSLDEAGDWGAEAIVVATPTSLHLEALRWAVEHGVHAYVEKPLAASVDGVREVLDAADRLGLVVATGVNLRFHPALETIREVLGSGRVGRLLAARLEAGQYLPDWHPEEDYRRSYAARSQLGGGALLTLSHELDMALWIAGPADSCAGVAARVSSLKLDVDDVAEVVCTHRGGAVTSIHADFLDRSYQRRSRWLAAEATLAWEWGGPVLELPTGRTLWAPDGYDPAETYRRALADFLRAVEQGGSSRATGRDGLAVLELCARIARPRA